MVAGGCCGSKVVGQTGGGHGGFIGTFTLQRTDPMAAATGRAESVASPPVMMTMMGGSNSGSAAMDGCSRSRVLIFCFEILNFFLAKNDFQSWTI